MSLYDGLGIGDQEQTSKESSDVAGWSQGIKLLQSQLQLKKATATKPQRDRERAEKGKPGIPDGSDNGGVASNASISNISTTFMKPVIRKQHADSSATKAKNINKENSFQSVFTISQTVQMPASDPDSQIFNIPNEYDPAYPNDYEILKDKQQKEKEDRREAERKKEMEDRERRRQERMEREREREREREKERERDRERDRDRDRDRERDRDRNRERDKDRDKDRERRRRSSDSDSDNETDRKKGKGATIAPPHSLIESGAAIPPPQFYQDELQQPAKRGSTFGFAHGFGADSVAAKIMQKYGFKEGQGLGKMEQGMSTALQVEKTSKRGGKILSEKDLVKETIPLLPDPAAPASVGGEGAEGGEEDTITPPPAAKQGPSLAEIMKSPTKVILLKNMVGPGEVDEDLEAEVTEECSKYGAVKKCVIYEIPGADDDEAVRIFVEFERQEAAIKAIVDLNGRYFGGRQLRGLFYDTNKFKMLQLSD